MYILHAPISVTKSGTSARVELPANIVAVSKLQAASEFAALEQLGGTLAQIALGDVGVTVQLAVRRQGTKPVQIDFKSISSRLEPSISERVERGPYNGRAQWASSHWEPPHSGRQPQQQPPGSRSQLPAAGGRRPCSWRAHWGPSQSKPQPVGYERLISASKASIAFKCC